MDFVKTNNAVMMSGFPKEVSDLIWVKKRNPFEVYT